jgi:SAM-dependent methyltransferase
MSEQGMNPEHFEREDSSSDRRFYETPRLVTHIDEAACAALSEFYARLLPDGGEILDLMSSCVSHLPVEVGYHSVTGLGMNEVELMTNPQLTTAVIADLNEIPVLPFADAAFDGCVISVSIQYLIQPTIIFREIARVLRPGAPCAVTFSNRMFPTKAIAVWRALGDEDHARLVGYYFTEAGGFEEPVFDDISPFPGETDPLFAVMAERLS